jgi:hypothetical protein
MEVMSTGPGFSNRDIHRVRGQLFEDTIQPGV